jgi:iron complex transport system substrate-binding protein
MRSKVLCSCIFLSILFCLFSDSAYAGPPKRIISLAPNITEILFALDLGDNIVSVTSFCDYPEAARTKQKIGGMTNPSLEGVVSLKPDIVIMTTDGNTKEFAERLYSLGIKTAVFRARRLSELPAAVRELGSALGVRERADSLAANIERSVRSFTMERQEKIRGRLYNSSLLFIVWPEPLIVAGPGTVIDDVIRLLGHENAAAKAKTPYPKYSVEEIIRQSPDVIIIGKGHENMQEISAALLKRLKTVSAVKKGRVFYVSDSLYRLGPRVIQGIREIDALLK